MFASITRATGLTRQIDGWLHPLGTPYHVPKNSSDRLACLSAYSGRSWAIFWCQLKHMWKHPHLQPSSATSPKDNGKLRADFFRLKEQFLNETLEALSGDSTRTLVFLRRDGWKKESLQACVDYLVGGLEHFLFSHILGISSSQLTFIFFQRGGPGPPTSYRLWLAMESYKISSFSAVGWSYIYSWNKTCSPFGDPLQAPFETWALQIGASFLMFHNGYSSARSWYWMPFVLRNVKLSTYTLQYYNIYIYIFIYFLICTYYKSINHIYIYSH